MEYFNSIIEAVTNLGCFGLALVGFIFMALLRYARRDTENDGSFAYWWSQNWRILFVWLLFTPILVIGVTHFGTYIIPEAFLGSKEGMAAICFLCGAGNNFLVSRFEDLKKHS